MLHIKLREWSVDHHASKNIRSLHTPSTRWVGSKGQTIFSESGHVAYQIKERSVDEHARKNKR